MDKIKLPELNNEKISSLQETYLKQIKKDPFFANFISEFKITDEEIKNNASKFIKAKNDALKCLNCNGKCHKTPEKMKINIEIDENRNFKNVFSICEYYQRVNELKKNYIYLDFPLSYLEYDFIKELTTKNDYYVARKPLILKLSEIMKNDLKKGLFLYGDNKVGKTFIMALFSKFYIEKMSAKVAFCNATELFKEMNDLYFSSKNDLLNLMDELANVDLLVLDSFGNEYKSDFVRDSFVLPLLSARFEKNKLTMATSNFNVDEIVQMYTLTKASTPKMRQFKNILNSLFDQTYLKSNPYIF